MGDALAIVLMERREFGLEDFARYHPGGSLGRSLALVRDIMRTDEGNPIVSKDTPVLDALLVMTGCRSAGVASVTDADGRLVGRSRTRSEAQAVGGSRCSESLGGEVMTPNPTTIGEDRLATEGLRILREHKWDNRGRRPRQSVLDVGPPGCSIL